MVIMKRVDVDVRLVSAIRYEWTCPDCGTKTYMDDYSEDRTRQTIQCKSCGVILYRQGPGEYGTEKPN